MPLRFSTLDSLRDRERRLLHNPGLASNLQLLVYICSARDSWLTGSPDPFRHKDKLRARRLVMTGRKLFRDAFVSSSYSVSLTHGCPPRQSAVGCLLVVEMEHLAQRG